ncbi:hypothetical protein DYQ94_12410 [Xanthomonas sp. LMG 8993]|nr:hypothetical protein [Xanthomonas sp. LMG 8993]QWM98620.1 hypothetical protein DGN21_04180 [Xanthomonas sp. MLO165]
MAFPRRSIAPQDASARSRPGALLRARRRGAQSDGAKVRTRWARLLDTPPGLHLKTKPDAVFAQWVEPAN